MSDQYIFWQIIYKTFNSLCIAKNFGGWKVFYRHTYNYNKIQAANRCTENSTRCRAAESENAKTK